MNTADDIKLNRLAEDTASSKLASYEARWRAMGDGARDDGSDNVEISRDANFIYLPMDNINRGLEKEDEEYEADEGDFIFAPYSKNGIYKELRISNVKWSKDGVDLYKVCGDSLAAYGKSEDGLPWYQVEGYEECSTTQSIIAYLLEDDTVKITTKSESNYKDKVLIATVKDGVINRIVKSVIMKSASAEQVEIVRDWTVRNNGTRWEIFNPVWNISDKQAVYPQSMDALCWNAVTDTSGKLYANLVSENKVADDGTVTTDRSVILSSTENDIGQACVSLTSVSSVLIGEFKKDCDGNITGFCQYSDGAIAQAEPKLSTINVFTSFKTATVETTGASSSSSTETHLQGFTTPIQVVAGKECTEPPALDLKLSDITGASAESWVPSVDISDIVDTSSSSSGTVTGQKIAISFTCNTTGEVISDEGSIYNGADGATYTPEVTSSKGEKSTDVTIAFKKDGETVTEHTFTVNDGMNGSDGKDGKDGEDGTTYTPSVSETTSGDSYGGTTHNVTITFTPDKSGASSISHTIRVKDGEKGEKGEKGDPGSDSTVPGPYFIPEVKIEKMAESSVVVGNKVTFCFTKSDDSSCVKSFGPVEIKNGSGEQALSLGPIEVIGSSGGKKLVQYIGSWSKEGTFTSSGKIGTELTLASSEVIKGLEYNFETAKYIAKTASVVSFSSEDRDDLSITPQPVLAKLWLDPAGVKAEWGNISSLKDGVTLGYTASSQTVIAAATKKPIVCTDSALSVEPNAATLLVCGTNEYPASVLVKHDGNIVTGGGYNPPPDNESVGSVVLCYITGANPAMFVTGAQPSEAEQVLIYTAVSAAQAADTYQNG